MIEPSQAHAFFGVAPVAFLFSVYCWRLLDRRHSRTTAAVVLLANIVLHAALA